MSAPERWSIEALKINFDQQLAACEQRFADLISAEQALRVARREDDQRAIDKAEIAVSRRLDTMNEIREQLTVQRADFVSQEAFRAELDKTNSMLERIRQDGERTRSLALPRESFETVLNEWVVWRRAVDQSMQARAGAEHGLTSLGVLITKMVAVVVGLLTIIIVLANYFAK